MNVFFNIFFLVSLILSSKIAIAGTIEENRAQLNRCDSFYCNGTTNNQVSQSLHSNLAIKIQPQAIQMPQVLERPRINFQIAPPPQPQNGRIAPQPIQSGSGEVNSNDEVEKSSVPSQSPSQPDSQGGSGGGSVSQFNSPNGANNNSQLKAGLLYSNDDEESKGKKVETANQSGSALTSLAPGMDPVKQNLKNSSAGGGDDSGSPYKPTSGTQASDFGNYQSGTPVAATGFVGQIKNELAEIAASMGENFFGDLGGRSGRSRSELAAKAEAAKNAKNNMAQAEDIKNRDLLRRGLAQFGGRGLANHLEFGASNTFLFGNMCKHYVQYAEKNNIPNDRSPCPMK